MYNSTKQTTQIRLDNSGLKAKLTRQYECNTSPSNDFLSTQTRLYQTQSLSKLLQLGQKKSKPQISKQMVQNNIQISSTVRTNTPKTCRTTQDYYFFSRSKEQNKIQLSQLISKTLQQSYSKGNNSQVKDNSFNKPIKTNTEKKYNLLSLDQNKLVQKAKTEKTAPAEKPEIRESKNYHFSLDDYVTQIAAPTPSKAMNMISPFKQTKSLSPTNRVLSISKKSIYYVSTMYESMKGGYDAMSQQFRDHAVQTFNSVGFCLNQVEVDQTQIQKKLVPMIQKNLKFRKTVVFDLDETLIHCNDNPQIKSDIYLPITFPTGDTVQAGINIRPWAKQILQHLSEVCEVVIFTASHQCYASQVIQFLDHNHILSAALFRDKCVITPDGVHIKDLRVLGRDMKDIVLIDNAAYSFGFHIENGIPIIPFYDNKDDKELKQLYDFLLNDVLPAYDCRQVLQSTFKLREFANFISPKTAIEKLYC